MPLTPKRGVKVEVILNRSQKGEKYTSADFVLHAGIRIRQVSVAKWAGSWQPTGTERALRKSVRLPCGGHPQQFRQFRTLPEKHGKCRKLRVISRFPSFACIGVVRGEKGACWCH